MVTKFGLVAFGAAGLVLVGRLVYPSIITNEILPIAVVLTVMGFIGGFPELYLKLMSPGLNNIADDLQVNLSKIGVDSYIIDPKGTEAIKHRNGQPWAAAKIKGKNIEFVELRVDVAPGSGGPSRRGRSDALNIQKIFALRGSIVNEDDFKASTYVSRNVGVGWSGGKLAEKLNNDTELKTLLLSAGSPQIEVRGIKSDSYVAIYKAEREASTPNQNVPTFGIGVYPCEDEFEIYDRIAGHIKDLFNES